jgi:hypothetical protein
MLSYGASLSPEALLARPSQKAATPSLGAFMGPTNAVSEEFQNRPSAPQRHRRPSSLRQLLTTRTPPAVMPTTARASLVHPVLAPAPVEPVRELAPRLLIDLDWHACRMPVDQRPAPDGRHLFCGKPQVPGCPYCVTHAERVRSASPSPSLRASSPAGQAPGR